MSDTPIIEPLAVTAPFHGPEVCDLAGVTYRQLDYWDRTGLAEPSVRAAGGSGTVRLYSDQDVLRVALVATLLRAGFSLSVLREHLGGLLASAQDGVGFFSAPNVVVTVDLAQLQARIDVHKQHLEQQRTTS